MLKKCSWKLSLENHFFDICNTQNKWYLKLIMGRITTIAAKNEKSYLQKLHNEIFVLFENFIQNSKHFCRYRSWKNSWIYFSCSLLMLLRLFVFVCINRIFTKPTHVYQSSKKTLTSTKLVTWVYWYTKVTFWIDCQYMAWNSYLSKSH